MSTFGEPRMSGFHFADATLADAPAVVRLINAAYRGHGGEAGWTDERALLTGPRIDAAAVRVDIATHRILVLRLAPGTPIAGCVRLEDAGDAAWSLSAIAVDPRHQGSGLGAALLAEVEAQALRSGIDRLRMTVIQLRATLIAWYERRGFRRTEAVMPFPYHDPSVGSPLRDDLELLVLQKTLVATGGPDTAVWSARPAVSRVGSGG